MMEVKERLKTKEYHFALKKWENPAAFIQKVTNNLARRGFTLQRSDVIELITEATNRRYSTANDLYIICYTENCIVYHFSLLKYV